jgi:two-component system chemotaxis response regulator CheY
MSKLDINMNILVVDDMLSMRKLVETHLTKLGYYQVEAASDGASAWDTLEKRSLGDDPIDFIFSDFSMPEMTGLEFLVKVRDKVNETRDESFLCNISRQQIVDSYI